MIQNFFTSIINYTSDFNLILAIQSVAANLSTKDIVDIIFTALIIGGFLKLFKRTKTTSIVITGTTGLIILYIIAVWLKLYTMLSVINALLGGVVIIVAIIFQKELRRFLEIIDIANIHRRFAKRKELLTHPHEPVIEILSNVVFSMAKRKIGALIVIPGTQSIEQYVTGGFGLNGNISEPLLLSIFDTSSPGHDGAIVLEEDIIKKFGVVLPLSERDNDPRLKHLGTRHRSALGLSEKTDALCIAVSEEKGRVSLFFDGEIEITESSKLFEQRLRSFLSISDTTGSRGKLRIATLSSLIKTYLKEGFVAIILALVFWLVISYPQLGIVQKKFDVPVVFSNLPQEVSLEKLTSTDVVLWVSGSQKDFDFLKEDSLKANIDMTSLVSDKQTKYASVRLDSKNVQVPAPLKLLKISPTLVEFKIVFK